VPNINQIIKKSKQISDKKFKTFKILMDDKSLDLKDIKNRKLFYYLLDKEKFLYTYYYDKVFTVKLLVDKNTSWYIKTIYQGGEDFISFHDLLKTFKKEIPTARESSRDFIF
jgi:hypothetical protein